MTRLSGWGPRGERLVDAAPAGHWKTTTVLAGLRRTGLIAPCVLDGAMTGAVFRAYVEQMLAPALAPGDVVVLDNLQAHKVAGVHEAIRAVGASLLRRLGPTSAIENASLEPHGKLTVQRESRRCCLWCGGPGRHGPAAEDMHWQDLPRERGGASSCWWAA
jgi:hypothetical protein